MDFSSVRIHVGPQAAEMGAIAFTRGADVHFQPGQYQPQTHQGQKLLGHELTHVKQQAQGRVRATSQLNGVAVNDDASLEREADRMGARAAGWQAATVSASTPGPGHTPVPGTRQAAQRQIARFKPVVQRTCGDNNAAKFSNTADPEYGGLKNNSGTCMDVLISGFHSGGSSPSVWPTHWPASGSSDRQVLNKYMVQGHLWNEKLGGPGNTRKNLTPITKSANSQHSAKVETPLKNDVKKSSFSVAHYVVAADYSGSPSAADITGSPTSADNAVVSKYVANWPQQIYAEYTAYDGSSPRKQLSYQSWTITNEK